MQMCDLGENMLIVLLDFTSPLSAAYIKIFLLFIVFLF